MRSSFQSILTLDWSHSKTLILRHIIKFQISEDPAHLLPHSLMFNKQVLMRNYLQNPAPNDRVTPDNHE